MSNIFTLLVAIALTVSAQLLLKQGTQTLGDVQMSPEGIMHIVVQIFKNIYLFGGLFLLGISFLLWIWLISKMHLNILYPVTVSLQLVLLAIGAWFWFGETLTLPQLVGMLVIITGIFLVSYTA